MAPFSDSQRQRAFEHAAKIYALVLIAGNRAMATDGPVSLARSELSEREYRDLRRYADMLSYSLRSEPEQKQPKIPRRRKGL